MGTGQDRLGTCVVVGSGTFPQRRGTGLGTCLDKVLDIFPGTCLKNGRESGRVFGGNRQDTLKTNLNNNKTLLHFF